MKSFIDQHKVKYPIVISSDGGAAYGVQGYPTAWLLDANGRILGETHAGNRDPILEALKGARPWPEDVPAAAPFLALRKAYEAGRLEEFDKLLQAAKAQQDPAAETGAALQKVQGLADAARKSALEEIRELEKGANWFAAQARLTELQKHFGKLEPGVAAGVVLDRFKNDKRISAEIQAGKRFEALRRQYDTSKSSERKKLIDALRAFMKQNPDTQAAEAAGRLIPEIGR